MLIEVKFILVNIWRSFGLTSANVQSIFAVLKAQIIKNQVHDFLLSKNISQTNEIFMSSKRRRQNLQTWKEVSCENKKKVTNLVHVNEKLRKIQQIFDFSGG